MRISLPREVQSETEDVLLRFKTTKRDGLLFTAYSRRLSEGDKFELKVEDGYLIVIFDFGRKPDVSSTKRRRSSLEMGQELAVTRVPSIFAGSTCRKLESVCKWEGIEDNDILGTKGKIFRQLQILKHRFARIFESLCY